jgi:hypothetical protein
LRITIVLDRAGEESAGRSLIAVLRQHEIKGYAEFVDSAVESMRRLCPITFPVATVVRSRLVEVS